MERDPQEEWNAAKLHHALEDAGTRTSVSNVRVIFQKLVSEGAIRRIAHGRYQATRSAHSHAQAREDAS
jgi:Fe2+ or Zn2+ uptake regulation protein